MDVELIGRFAEEFRGSSMAAYLTRAKVCFDAEVRGATASGRVYGFGALKIEDAANLYGLIRVARPGVVVETGVCNGVSTAAILLGLDRNGKGRLYSVDFPEHAGTVYPPGTFWEGKGGAAVPGDREPGWVVPEKLRARWELLLGRSQDVLPLLLERLGTIDLFLHDSEHSYDCMSFEFELAYSRLRDTGILAADDVRWNSAFGDFAELVGVEVAYLGEGFAYFVKEFHPSPQRRWGR